MVEGLEATKSLKTGATFDELYRQLNPEQRQAVDALEGPVMVLAGPGTGKTQVLAMRIAHILRQTQMDPWNILCLTFTETAAAAMRTRLINITGDAAYYVRIATFHSFCNDIIQEHPERFASGAGWQALSDVERVAIVRSLLDELPESSALKPFGHTYLYLPDSIRALGWLKKEGVTDQALQKLLDANQSFLETAGETLDRFFALPHTKRSDADCERVQVKLRQLCDEASSGLLLWPYFEALFARYTQAAKSADGKRAAGKARTKLKNDLKKTVDRMRSQLPRQRELVALYRGYQQKLAEAGHYDYEDMIMQVLEHFRKDDAFLARYQEQFQYVLVDEYQDTNGAQNEVVRLLGSFYPNPNIFVVGDDQQSIFRFQGASLENLLSFYEHYRDDVHVISLQRNYRSGQAILDAAGAVIGRNAATVSEVIPGLRRKLTSASGDSASLKRYAFDSEDEENYFVVEQIKELLAAGVPPHEIAILYRFNRDVESLLDILLRTDIPVHVAAGENALTDRRVRQFLQLLGYIADEQRDAVLADIVQYDFWDFDPLATLKVLHFAGRRRLPLLNVLSDVEMLAEAGVPDPAPFVALVGQLAKWRLTAANDTLQRLFDDVLQQSGLLQRIVGDDQQLSALHHLTAVFGELRRLNAADSRLTVRQFVDRLALLDEHGLPLVTEPWQTSADSVQLMTAHRAKGLEFEHVFLIRLVDRHWGNVRDRNRLSLPLGVVQFDPIAGQENNEDERRLFYVALTRAKRHLYLSHAEQDDRNREHVPSLFVREIPEQYVQEVETSETDSQALQRLTAVRLATRRAQVASDVRAWLTEQLKSYVMSVTHLNNYLACPRLFYYRNLLRVPAAKTKHMALGTAVHNALRDVFVRFNAEGAVPPVQYVVDQFRFYLQREILADNDRNDSLALGERVLKSYYAHYAPHFAPTTLLEYDFRAHGVHLDDVLLTGKLDKIEVVDDANTLVNVVDYKTGNPDNAAKHMKESGTYRRQLVFYKLLCDLSPRFAYEMVSGELDFVQPSARTGKFVKKRFQITPSEVADLSTTISRVWREIKSLQFLEAEGCGKCEYCQL